MNGILLVDKPAGWTSHDVVAKVRSILRQATGEKIKIGHVGTLDPAATGLLVLVLGAYTKRAGELSKLDKTYVSEVTLGKTSPTGDGEGEISAQSTRQPSLSEIDQVLASFVGKIEQKPPAYSAIKVAGQRAYKLARAGKIPQLEPRQITIYEISNVNYSYPQLSFTAKVSSGTYMRSLAIDIGEKLGTGAYLSALCRTSIADYRLQNALEISDLTEAAVRTRLIKLS